MDPSTVSLPLASVDGHRVPRMTSTGVGTEDPPSPLGQGPLVIIQEVSLGVYKGNTCTVKLV